MLGMKLRQYPRLVGIAAFVATTLAPPAQAWQVRRVTTHEADDRHPAWSPDGKWLAFETQRHGQWDLYAVNETGALRRLTSHDASDRYPSWDPSGTKIVFHSNRTGSPELHIYDLHTDSVSMLVSLSGAEVLPAWSPDSSTIAFTRDLDGELDLYSVRSDGSMLSRLTTHPARDVWPRWSPDGERLVFFSRRDTDGAEDDIYVLHLATGDIRRLTTARGPDFVPAWAPADQRIAYAHIAPDGTRQLRILTADNGASNAIDTGRFSRITEPSWDPTGRQIAFAARSGERYDIYIVRIDN